MNIGIRLHDTKPGTLRERLNYAKAQGFSCAHVALSKCLDDFAMADAPKLLTDELAAKVRGDFEATGMDFAVLGCYLQLAQRDEEARARTQAIYKAHLRFAAKAGARVVGTETHAGKLVFEKPCWASEDAFRLFIDCTRPVARYAEEVGAILAIEPVVDHIISNPERAERMLEELHSDHVQIILDTVNLLASSALDRTQDIIEEAIRRFGDRVRVLHMKDYVPDPQSFRPRSLACGLGEMNYERLLTFAREKDLPMTLEDTVPGNAEAARLHLERVAAGL